MNLLPGDVVFVMHHKSWLSRVLARFMKSRWSHSAMVADVGTIEVWLHETSDTQTKVGMLSIYIMEPEDEIEVLRLPLGGEASQRAAARNAGKYHDEMYGYSRLLGAGMRRILMRLGWKSCPMLWPWGGPLCMMIPHRGLMSTFISMPELGSIDTEELYEWCKKNGTIVAYKQRGLVGLQEILQ